jgi:hypothetical protein
MKILRCPRNGEKTHPRAHLPANASVGHFRNLNLYRVTVRDQKGKIAARETRAASLVLSVQDLDEKSEIVKVERIHPSTGEVLGISQTRNLPIWYQLNIWA